MGRTILAALALAAAAFAADPDLRFGPAALTTSPGASVYIDGSLRNGSGGTGRLGNVTVANVTPASVTLDPDFAALRDQGLAPGAAWQGHLMRLTYPSAAPLGTYSPIHVRVDFNGQVFEADFTVQITSGGVLYRIPQVAAGHLWSTTIVLSNPQATTVDFTISFLGGDGSPLDVPFPALGIHRSLSGQLAPGATRFFTADDGEPLTQGWAEIAASDRILAVAAYRKVIDGRSDWETGATAVNAGVTRAVLYFDNSGPYTTSLAIANPSARAEDVTLAFHDENGAMLGTATMQIAPRGQAVARSPSAFPFTADHRGSVEFSAGGQEIAVLGLRFNSIGGVVALPVY